MSDLFASPADGPAKPSPIEAGHEGECGVCDFSIAIGDPIVRDPDTGNYIHDRCWKHRRT